jgi:hypothetical protein
MARGIPIVVISMKCLHRVSDHVDELLAPKCLKSTVPNEICNFFYFMKYVVTTYRI